MRKLISRLDWLLLLPMVLLISIGIIMVFSASVGSFEQFSFVTRQIIYALVGLVLSLAVIFLTYRFFLNISGFAYFILLGLLVITFFLGVETKGSTRWIDFGFFTLQVSELAKPILVIVLTSVFLKFPPVKLRNVVFSLVIVLVPILFIFIQPDLGSAITLAIIWMGLVYIAGIRVRYLVVLFLLGLLLLPIGFEFLKDYQKERLFSFLNPASDPLGSGYNLVQSIIAVGSGQLLGRGFGRGTQSHLNFLPEQKTDFIFATTAEELGFIGVSIILILFSILLWRVLSIGSQSDSNEGALICYGAAIVIGSQLFINAGMNMGLLPITGITLPFISFGGSSLVSMMLLIALVQSVHLDRR